MLRSEIVKLADIRPDENNPRKAFDGLDELAASFAYTPDRPGEPFTPPIVVQDGNVRRIVDGERRYRAMVKAGAVDECLCNVADTLEEANALAMMLATDDKVSLSDAERCYGAQQMLMLGVPEEQVEAVGRLRKGSGRRLKRAVRALGGPAQMSMDVLFKLGGIDDDERVAELAQLSESGTEYFSAFSRRLRVYDKDQENGRTASEMLTRLMELGISPKPAEPSPAEWKRVSSCCNVDGVEKAVAEMGDGDWCCWISRPPVDAGDGYGYMESTRLAFYVPADAESDGEEDPEIARRAERVREFERDFLAAGDARMRFMHENRGRLGELGELSDMLWEALSEDEAMREWSELGLEIERCFSPVMLPLAWYTVDAFLPYDFCAEHLDGAFEPGDDHDGWCRFVDAMRAAGYEPSPIEESLYGSVKAAMETVEDDGSESEGSIDG